MSVSSKKVGDVKNLNEIVDEKKVREEQLRRQYPGYDEFMKRAERGMLQAKFLMAAAAIVGAMVVGNVAYQIATHDDNAHASKPLTPHQPASPQPRP